MSRPADIVSLLRSVTISDGVVNTFDPDGTFRLARFQ